MYFKVRKNKRSMEYITHMRKLQAINTFARSYDYTITLIMRKNHYLLFENWMLLYLKKKLPFTPLLSRMLTIVPSQFVWNWPSSSGEGELFKILSMYFCFFIIISPWKRAWPFVWTKWKHLHPSKDAFVPSLDEIGSVFLEKMIMWKKIKTDRSKDGQQVIRNWYSHRLFYLYDEKISNGQALAFCKWSSLYRYLLPLVFLHSPLLER